jgi:hypothetical protein
VSKGERPVGLTEPPGRVRPGRPAPTGGPGPIGRLGLTGEVERGFSFNQFFLKKKLNRE